MPVIPLNQLYPKMDEYPPTWVRSADGSRYEPDWSGYPEDAPRWQVSHVDPVTGRTIIALPDAERAAAEHPEEVIADVDDREPDIDAGASEDTEAEPHAGAAPGAA